MSVASSCMNPFRPADWRWQRAMDINDGRGPATTKRTDLPVGYKWIRKAVRFLRSRAQAATDFALSQLSAAMPEVFWAHWLWSHGGPQRASVEAHLLAREDDYEIGYRCGIPPAVVDAYESLFFNVREKLQHQQYILHIVIGEVVQRGLSGHEYDLLWKLYGYFRGPHVLAALESSFADGTWCGRPDTVGTAVQDDAIGTMKIKAALAAKTVAVNSHTQLPLLEQFTKFVEIERTTDSAGKAQDQLLDHISAMMAAMPFNVAGTDPRTGRRLPPGPLAEFDVGSVELTFSETMRVAARRPIADAGVLRDLTFQDVSAETVHPVAGLT